MWLLLFHFLELVFFHQPFVTDYLCILFGALNEPLTIFQFSELLLKLHSFLLFIFNTIFELLTVIWQRIKFIHMIYGQFIPLQCYFLLKITIILPIIFISYLSFLTFPIIEFNHFLAYIYLLIQFTFTILIILLKIVPFGHSSLQKLFIHIMLVLKLLHLLGIIF